MEDNNHWQVRPGGGLVDIGCILKRGDRVRIVNGQHTGREGRVESQVRQWLEHGQLVQAHGYHVQLDAGRLATVRAEAVEATASSRSEFTSTRPKVSMYSDGACKRNPGPGGHAAILIHPKGRREVAGGYRLTTNNRMELMAVIAGLEALTTSCIVTVTSDSTYIVNAITKGWARGWQLNDWRLRSGKRDIAKNADLWKRLLELCDKHDASFKWVRGHAGHPENERCDELATWWASQPNLPEDTGYEPG